MDVEGFGDPRRTNPHRVTVREGMYASLERAFANAGISWRDCHHEDTGDGILVLAPAELPKAPFAEALPRELAGALRGHNAAHRAEKRIRLRMALHAGEVSFDEHGVTAASVNLTFRLLDAARAASQRGLPLAALAAQLRDMRGRLDALDAGGMATNVRAVFSWSYRHLDQRAARMFRFLGLHPGPDISLPAAASLAGIPLTQTRAALTKLTRAHLVTEHILGRFALHDLLRAYAAEQAAVLDSDAERRAAIRRVLDHYLHTGHAADLLLHPHRDPITLAPTHPGAAPESLADHGHALAWFEAEHQVLLAAITRAASSGFDTHAWQIPWTLATFFDRRGHWHDYAGTQRTALAAAQRAGDQYGQARARHDLGNACVLLGSYDDAETHMRQALTLLQQLSDHVGQSRMHRAVAWVLGQQGRHAEALGHARQALDLYRELGHRLGQAYALNQAGWCHAQLGDAEQALTFCQQALALHRLLGSRHGEADTWDSLGYAHHRLGHHPRAVACYGQALELWRGLSDRYDETLTLNQLGDTHRAAGNQDAARSVWRQALAILDDLHHPDAEQVRAKLRDPRSAG